jgi:hypothetical protein
MFASELELFFIGIINLPLEAISLIEVNTIQSERTTNVANYGVENKINHKIDYEIIISKKLEVTFEYKVYLETYYQHKLGQIEKDETLTKVKVLKL